MHNCTKYEMFLYMISDLKNFRSGPPLTEFLDPPLPASHWHPSPPVKYNATTAGLLLD